MDSGQHFGPGEFYACSYSVFHYASKRERFTKPLVLDNFVGNVVQLYETDL